MFKRNGSLFGLVSMLEEKFSSRQGLLAAVREEESLVLKHGVDRRRFLSYLGVGLAAASLPTVFDLGRYSPPAGTVSFRVTAAVKRVRFISPLAASDLISLEVSTRPDIWLPLNMFDGDSVELPVGSKIRPSTRQTIRNDLCIDRGATLPPSYEELYNEGPHYFYNSSKKSDLASIWRGLSSKTISS